MTGTLPEYQMIQNCDDVRSRNLWIGIVLAAVSGVVLVAGLTRIMRRPKTVRERFSGPDWSAGGRPS
ncbi:MAG TPA: hypothetical protein VHF06_08525 [Pseudonocardiaceae bacterium]|nr:hypothetical protein [Pseudonocardiaceae bacterium]